MSKQTIEDATLGVLVDILAELRRMNELTVRLNTNPTNIKVKGYPKTTEGDSYFQPGTVYPFGRQV